jgi:hypothetical protein
LKSDSRSHAHHNQQSKKPHELVKIHHSKGLPSEAKSAMITNTSKENPTASLRAATAHADVIICRLFTCKKCRFSFHFRVLEDNNHHQSLNQASPVPLILSLVITSNQEIHLPFLPFQDEPLGRRSILSDGSERLDLLLTSTNIDSELNESLSSKSNPIENTDPANQDSGHPLTNPRSAAATPAILATNTSRASTSMNVGQSTSRPISGRLSSITERRKSPDVLLKKWIKNQKIRGSNPDEPLPLNVSEYFRR